MDSNAKLKVRCLLLPFYWILSAAIVIYFFFIPLQRSVTTTAKSAITKAADFAISVFVLRDTFMILRHRLAYVSYTRFVSYDNYDWAAWIVNDVDVSCYRVRPELSAM